MKIRLDTNLPEVKAAFQVSAKQAEYALYRTVLSLTLEGKKQFADGLQRRFKITRVQFAFRAAKITKWPRRKDPSSETRIEPPGGPERAGIWAQHQFAGVKTPQGLSLAIPQGVRLRSKSSYDKNKPSALDFKPHGRGGRLVMRGRKADGRGVVLIRSAAGKGGIWRRVGKGRRSRLVLEFNLVPQGRLKARLQFYETYARVVRGKYLSTFRAEFAKAMATAKP